MNVIDERVLSMKFDNQQFEQGAQKSMSTLDKLKQALRLDGAARGIENIENTARSFNLDGMFTAVDAIKDRFSVFGIFADQIIRNIANSFTGMLYQGYNTLKSISDFGQWRVGWDKYAEKTSSVQTIMAATAKEFTDTGEQMSYVNSQLDKLNWFTDETSYSFLDMVNNIGKFTSNSVKMDTAVTAMQGISTWAAISGANVQEAGRAMYNLSQAIATGTVKLIDWKSIENANMATAEFKETVIQTALAEGTLKDAGNGVIKTLKGGEVSVSNFNAALQDGWFTSEVLLKSLDKYGGATDKLYELSELTGMTATELLEALDNYKNGTDELTKISNETGVSVEDLTARFKELNSEEYALGLKAFKAAQEAKTFQEALSATSDAVSTGWMKTFELIFGNYEEAKKLWTGLANVLYDIFAEPGNTRNEILEKWVGAGGRDGMLAIAANLFEALKQPIEAISEAFRRIIPPMTGERLAEITKKIEHFTSKLIPSENTLKAFTNIGRVLGYTLEGIMRIGSLVYDNVILPVFKTLKPLGNALLPITKHLAKMAVRFSALAREGGPINRFLFAIGKTLSSFFNKAVQSASRLVDIFATKWSWVGDIFSRVSSVIGKAFSAISDSLLSTNFFGEEVSSLGDIFDKFFKTIETGVGFLGETLGKGWDGIKEFIDKVKGYFNFEDSDFNFLESITKGISNFIDKIKNIFSNFGSGEGGGFSTVLTALQKLGSKIAEIFQGIWEHIINGLNTVDFGKIFREGILGTILINLSQFTGQLGSPFEAITGIFESATEKIDSIKEILDGVKGTLESWQNSLNAGVLLKIAAAIGILSLSLTMLSDIDRGGLENAVGAITVLFIELIGALAAFQGIMGDGDGKGLQRVSKALVNMTTAIWFLSMGFEKLAVLSWDEIGRGITAIGALLAELAIFQFLIQGSTQGLKNSKSLIALAAAVGILAGVVFIFGKMKLDTVVQGVAAVGAILLILGGFMKLAGTAKHVLSTAAAMAVMSVSIGLLVASVFALGSISNEKLTKGLLGLAVGLIELSIAMHVMKKAVAGALAMLIMAAALAIFVPALVLLSSIPTDKLVVTLLALAGGLSILILASLWAATALGPVVPILLALAGAIALLGIGALAFGAGVVMLAAGIASLAIAFSTGATTIVLAIQTIAVGIAEIIPMVVTALAKGIIEFAVTIGNGAPLIANAALQVLMALLGAIIAAVPAIVGGVMILLTSLFNTIAANLPGLIQAGMNLMIAFIDGMAHGIMDNADRIMSAVNNLINSIIYFALTALQSFVGNIPIFGDDLVNALEGMKQDVSKTLTPIEGAEMISKLPDGMVTELDNSTRSISSTADKIPQAISESILNGQDDVNGATETLGGGIVETLTSTVGDGFTNFGGDFSNLGSMIPESIGQGITDNEGLVLDPMQLMGENGIDMFSTSLTDGLPDVSSASQQVSDATIEPLQTLPEEADGIGLNFVESLAGSMRNNSSIASAAAAQVAAEAAQSARNELKIESPSKVAAEIGRYFDLGLAGGINANGKYVDRAATSVVNDSTDGLRKAIGNVLSLLNEDMDTAPTISPVLDLSNIENGANRLDSIFGSRRALSLASANSAYVSAANLAITPEERFMNELNDKFNNLVDKLENDNRQYTFETHVDLNGREIARGTANYMNSELNRIEKFNNRRDGIK